MFLIFLQPHKQHKTLTVIFNFQPIEIQECSVYSFNSAAGIPNIDKHYLI